MLKSRALMLSACKCDNESGTPCWCQADRETDRPHAGPRPFRQNSSFPSLPNSSLFLLVPLFFVFIPFLCHGHHTLLLPPIFLPHLSLLSHAALVLIHSLSPTQHRPTHTRRYPPNTPAFPSDIDKWRLAEMTASLLMFSSDTT